MEGIYNDLTRVSFANSTLITNFLNERFCTEIEVKNKKLKEFLT